MEEGMQLKSDIFAYIFKLSNMLQVYLDKALADDELTAKQFFLMIAIDSFGTEYPTYKQAADISGSTYQNVKQIALKLETNGFLDIQDDPMDRRAKRMVLTAKCRDYWQKRDLKDIESLNILFQDFNIVELKDLLNGINKLIEGVKRIERT